MLQNHTASRHPGEDTVSATIKRKTVVRETIIEEEDEPEVRDAFSFSTQSL
jgi:hypothetical protein